MASQQAMANEPFIALRQIPPPPLPPPPPPHHSGWSRSCIDQVGFRKAWSPPYSIYLLLWRLFSIFPLELCSFSLGGNRMLLTRREYKSNLTDMKKKGGGFAAERL